MAQMASGKVEAVRILRMIVQQPPSLQLLRVEILAMCVIKAVQRGLQEEQRFAPEGAVTMDG